MILNFMIQWFLAQTDASGGFLSGAMSYIQETTLYSLLYTGRNGLILLSCWVIAWIAGKMITNNKILKSYKEHWVYGFMLLYCNIMVWASGTRPGAGYGEKEMVAGTGISGNEFGYRITLGIILAGSSILAPAILYWFMGTKYFPFPKLGKFLKKHIYLQE